MEGVVVVVVVVAVVFLFFLLMRWGSNNVSSQPTSPSPRQAVPEIRRTQPPRFDEGSAKHLHKQRVLNGPAYVTDGDTIKIGKTQVRLFGVDAPELNHPYGKQAKWALHKLCKGQIVRAEVTDEDAHGRTVAQCYLPDGSDLSAEMVKQGLAIDWPKFSGGKYKNLETPDARKKLFLADARQKGRMHVWEQFEARETRQGK